jgi:hypothetical protein
VDLQKRDQTLPVMELMHPQGKQRVETVWQPRRLQRRILISPPSEHTRIDRDRTANVKNGSIGVDACHQGFLTRCLGKLGEPSSAERRPKDQRPAIRTNVQQERQITAPNHALQRLQ